MRKPRQISYGATVSSAAGRDLTGALHPSRGSVPPNMPDYERARSEFSWTAARSQLDGPARRRVEHRLRGGRPARRRTAGRDRRAALPRQARATRGRSHTRSCSGETDRFANVLRALGVERGERVFVLAGRIPELYVAALGTLKHGSVFSPLFSAFGPEPIEQRLRLGDARVLVTTPALYRRKVAQLRERLPGLRTSCWSASRRRSPRSRTSRTSAADAPPSRTPARSRPPAAEDMALLHFTSGTTGTPKGAVHVHEAVVAHRATGAHRARPARRRRVLVHRRSRAGSPAPPTGSSLR